MELGQRGNIRGGLPRKIVFNMPTRIDADFFRDRLETLLVMETTTSWQAYYGAFVAYQEENPDVPIVRTTKYHGLNLEMWVGTQRRVYKKGKLLAERIERLEEAGIVWDPNEEQWETGYRAFIAYQKENPDVPIIYNTKYHDYNLGQWVGTQRKDYNNGTLPAERIERLEEAGIIWDALEEQWQAGYQAFVAYQKENPNVPIPYKAKYHDLNLGKWIGTQRWNKNKGTLSAERIELLEEAGIIWDAQEEAWQAYYGAFVAYQKENPNIPIPQTAKYHDLNLGQWVGQQRVLKTNGTLSAERIERLDEAGFIWSKRPGRTIASKKNRM